MKLVVSSSELLDNLVLAGGVIVNKPVIPILENFLFQIKGNELTISGTDLETFITTRMEVTADGDAEIAVPSRMLTEILRSLPEQPVTFNINAELSSMEITTGNGKFKITGQPADDFPKAPPLDEGQSFSMKAGELTRAIAKTVFATGNDELRLNLTGLYFELTEDSLCVVATDANRLVKFINNNVKPGIEHNFILPKKPANILKSALSNGDLELNVSIDKTNVRFEAGDITVISRLIEENYPNYKAVIPTENPNELDIDRSDFYDSVKRIAIVSNKSTHQIRLKIAGSEMQVSAEDSDLSNEGSERINCAFQGEDMEIGFNSRYLLDMLGALNTGRVKMRLSTPNRAGILLPAENEEGEDILMLVMPMMLNNF